MWNQDFCFKIRLFSEKVWNLIFFCSKWRYIYTVSPPPLLIEDAFWIFGWGGFLFFKTWGSFLSEGFFLNIPFSSFTIKQKVQKNFLNTLLPTYLLPLKGTPSPNKTWKFPKYLNSNFFYIKKPVRYRFKYLTELCQTFNIVS